jgi:hypothetical protein
MKRSVGYAYPWDYVQDLAAAPRAADLGLDAVAVAASYHATRAATPLHPDHRIFEAEHAACYVPVRDQAWRGHRLVPVLPSWDPDGDSFGNACRQLRAEGLQVEAWIVLTHNSALGRRHPDLVVRNAFGDVYPYALCPAAQDVQEYCLTLVEEIVSSGPVRGVVLEACGPMGVEHGGKHDKVEVAEWDEARLALLSLCFCQACEGRYAAAGVDHGHLARLVRVGVDAGSGTIEDCLGDELAAEVAAVRTGIAKELRRCWWPGADRWTRTSGSRCTARMIRGPPDHLPHSSRRWGKGSTGSSRHVGTPPREAGASAACGRWWAQVLTWGHISGWTVGGPRAN